MSVSTRESRVWVCEEQQPTFYQNPLHNNTTVIYSRVTSPHHPTTMNGLVNLYILLCALCAVAVAAAVTSDNKCEEHDLVHPITPSDSQTLNWAIVCLIRRKDAGNSARNKALATYLSTYSEHHNFTILMFSEDHFTADDVKTWSVQFSKVGQVKLVDTSVNAYWIDGVRKYGYK